MIPTSMPQMGAAINMSVLNNGTNGMNNILPNHTNLLNALTNYNQLIAAGYQVPNPIFNESMAENALKLQAYFEYARSLNNEKMLEDSLVNKIPTENIPLNDIPNPEKHEVEEREPAPENGNDDKKNENSKQEDDNVQEKNANSVKKTGTSRRKGKAVKLDKHILEKDSDDEQVNIWFIKLQFLS